MSDHTRFNLWLSFAIAQAEKSWREGGIPIGAVLVDPSLPDGPSGSSAIIAAGHNLRVQTADPTAHAEVVCIRNAGRRRDWSRLTLISTLSPCPMCAGTAVLFRIPRVIIGENSSFLGAESFMRDNHIALTTLNDQRCISLMHRLIAEKPDLWNEDIGL